MNVTMTEDLDCSDGAKMLIERMQTHPQEFKSGYNTKFGGIVSRARDVSGGVPRDMSMRDAKAIVAAAETYLFEPWLAEEVITQLMPPERKQVEIKSRPLTQQNLNAEALKILEQQYDDALKYNDPVRREQIKHEYMRLRSMDSDTLRYNTKDRYYF